KTVEYLTLVEDLGIEKLEHAQTKMNKQAVVARNKRLMKTTKEQKELLVTMEARIEALEEECPQLDKDNDDLLNETDNDAAYKEDFDMEPQSE
ncbi:hypothetical protein Q8G71_34335, partial [Klebsiella pneumoniae]